MGGSGNLRCGFPVVDDVGAEVDGAVDGAGTDTPVGACAINLCNMASIFTKALVDASATVACGGTPDPGGPRFAGSRCPVSSKY
jgi:hypothetical protein